jgi:S-adenosylmethionine:tRNA ribosyltransferase-isomerase
VIVSIAPEPELPEAERPPEQRGLARNGVLMLVADSADGSLEHLHFDELPELLGPPDVLVINTSRTLPAALPARAPGGMRVLLHLSTPAPGEHERRWIVELRTSDGAAATRVCACSCPTALRPSCSRGTSARGCGLPI